MNFPIQPDSDQNPTTGKPSWFIYLLCCRDSSLYTGITTDLSRRLHEHNNSGKGAKYTQARRPVRLVYWEPAPDRAAAARREYQIRKLSASTKKRLIADFSNKRGSATDFAGSPPDPTPRTG